MRSRTPRKHCRSPLGPPVAPRQRRNQQRLCRRPDAASPDAAPATQSGAEEEEPARAAEGPKRLLLVFDDRPYTLRAEHIIGLTVPDELAGDNHSLSNRALCGGRAL